MSYRRFTWLLTGWTHGLCSCGLRPLAAGILWAALAVTASAGTPVPSPINGPWSNTLLAADGNGGLFCFEGDTVYELSGGAFSPLVSGIATTANAWVDPAGFGVNSAGTMAYVATGFSGRLVEVNLTTHSSRELSGARLGQGNYGLAVDPIYGKVFVTDDYTQNLYAVSTAGNGLLTLLKDYGNLATFGGAIAFAPDGRLIVPLPRTRSDWPRDDTFQVDVYEFSRSFLNAVAAGQMPTGGQVVAAGVSISGSMGVAADRHGNTYMAAGDAIYRLDPEGRLTVWAGDPSVNVFDASATGVGFMGLAYDALNDQLFYAHRDRQSDPWQLMASPAPEPATLLLLAFGGLVLWHRRAR